ncbi:MAG: hypothetical protein AAB693_02905 [Patescibacteria group bacterium]
MKINFETTPMGEKNKIISQRGKKTTPERERVSPREEELLKNLSEEEELKEKLKNLKQRLESFNLLLRGVQTREEELRKNDNIIKTYPDIEQVKHIRTLNSITSSQKDLLRLICDTELEINKIKNGLRK